MWPCPQCRYPMVLRAGQLRCEYPPHQSRFGLVPGSGKRGGPPVLTGGRGRLATAAEGVLCLDWGVWRYITCPGLSEVGLMQWLEKQEGVRVERWGPRTLDVDVLWVEGVTVSDPDLSVPHPRMWERRFVLAPLRDLAPDPQALVPAR